jgi:hypothetical protein
VSRFSIFRRSGVKHGTRRQSRTNLPLDECFDVVNHAQNNGNGRNGKPSEEHDLEQLNTGVKNDKHGNFLTEKRLLPGRVKEL